MLRPIDILVIPTWIVTNVMVMFLPKSHPWWDRYFPLDDWADGATPLTLLFSIGMWVSGLGLLLGLSILSRG